jgi:hypothetical protein
LNSVETGSLELVAGGSQNLRGMQQAAFTIPGLRSSEGACAGSALLLLATLAGDTACTFSAPASCTLIGCSDQSTVTFSTTTGRWADGTYTLNVAADGTAGTCTFAIDSAAGTLSGACGGVSAINPTELDGGRVDSDGGVDTFVFSGVSGSYDIVLPVEGAPLRLAVTLSIDGKTIANATLMPNYRRFQPNGPGCDSTCLEASSTVTAGE